MSIKISFSEYASELKNKFKQAIQEKKEKDKLKEKFKEEIEDKVIIEQSETEKVDNKQKDKQKVKTRRPKKEFDRENEDKDLVPNHTKKMKKLYVNMKQTSYSYYFLFLVMCVLGVFGLTVGIRTYRDLAKQDYTTYTPGETAQVNSNSVQYIEDVSSIATTEGFSIEDVKSSKTSSEDTKKDTSSTSKTDTTKVVPPKYVYSYIKPLSGSTLKAYSMDKVVYSKTLDMWKTHDGIDIKGKLGDAVKATEKGKVENVYTDNFYGPTVIIDHQNGYKTVYRNLDNIKVKKGDVVAKGEIIGHVGNSGVGESADGPHIHFEVIKSGEIVDPKTIGIK